MTLIDDGYDSHLDPWCVVPMTEGKSMLFGYALYHRRTGGLAWISSSDLVQLDIQAERAVTYGGRHYRLGRRFEPLDVGAEGDEARWAFELLAMRDYESAAKLRDIDHLWLMVCKAARHLRLKRPLRTRPAILMFFDEHGERYEAVRAAARRRSR